MIRTLQALPQPLRVGLVGAGCMGAGIAHQLARTPGMRLEWIASRREAPVRDLAARTGTGLWGTEVEALLGESEIDVLVEASGSIEPAYRYATAALEQGVHVVLMNAEVDLVHGAALMELAAARQRVCTSDAGDQHGVLARMIQEIQLWGLEVVQAGNVKGFLNRHATADELTAEAAKRRLSPQKCCAFTDGTKLQIEMALLANGFGLGPPQVGMTGPRVAAMEEVPRAFDLDGQAASGGVVDYVLGPGLGAGVYVIARSDDPVQHPYLQYYKMGDGPYYFFRRDFHLCHLETPTAIALACLRHEAVLQPWAGKVADVYAFAKSAWPAGTRVPHGVGGDHFYGQIAASDEAARHHWVPITELDRGADPAVLAEAIAIDAPLTRGHLVAAATTHRNHPSPS